MFNDKVKSLIIDFANREDFIQSLIETGPRTDPTVEKTDLLDYNFTFGTENISRYRSTKFFMDELGDDFLLVQKRKVDLSHIDNTINEALSYVVITNDIVRINLTFMQNLNIQDYVNNMSMAKVIIDKTEEIDISTIPINKVYIYPKPSKDDYLTCCNEFFVNVLDIGKGLYEGKTLYAINKYYEEVKNRLDEMTAYFIGCTYDFRVDVGNNYENFKLYLDTEHYDRYLMTYPEPDREKMWATLFNSCMLFRKQALVVGDKLGFEYIKFADRDILSYLRKLWNQYSAN